MDKNIETEPCSCPNPSLCKQLKTHICGRLYEIWMGINIDENSAENYRAYWREIASDNYKMPSLIQKGINFTKATVSHISAGYKSTPPEIHKQRLELCLVCEYYKDKKCTQCGCGVELKISWLEQKCPVNKW